MATASEPLFGRGNSLFESSESKAKERVAFATLKPLCVTLMGLATSPSSNPAAISKALADLQRSLLALPNPRVALAQNLIQYVFLPVSTLLSRQTNPIEDIKLRSLSIIAFLVKYWDGIELKVWEQIWLLSVGVLRSSIATTSTEVNGKGKARDRSDEGINNSLLCLFNLISPKSSISEVAEDEEDDFSYIFDDPTSTSSASIFPTRAMVAFVTSPKFLPIFGSTLSTIISLAAPLPSPPPLPTPHRLLALKLLYTLIDSFLPPSNILSQSIIATIMPGAISGMCKICVDSSSVHHELVVEALKVLTEVVEKGLSDDICRILLHGSQGERLVSFDDLAKWADPESTTPSSASIVDEEKLTNLLKIPEPPMKAMPTLPSPSHNNLVTPNLSWLNATSSQLLPSLVSILSIRSHQHPLARKALVEMSFDIASTCSQTLQTSLGVLVSNLLFLAGDEFPDVADLARDSLLKLVNGPASNEILQLLKSTTESNLTELPRLILNRHEHKVWDTSKQITTYAELFYQLHTSSSLSANMFSIPKIDILGPHGGVEKWGWTLLSCLEFSVSSLETAGGRRGNIKGMERIAWSSATSSGAPTAAFETDSFPPLSIKHLESPKSLVLLQKMLTALGKASGIDSFFSVEHFVSVARAKRRDQKDGGRAIAALWCAQTIFEGVSESLSTLSRTPNKNFALDEKRMKKAAKLIVKTLVEFGDNDPDEALDVEHEPMASAPPSHSTTTDLEHTEEFTPVQYVKGVNALTTLLDGAKPTAQSSDTTQTSKDVLLRCLSLSFISLLSRSQTTAFRPLLLDSLYYVLSNLSSPSPLIQSYARTALAKIAYDTGYASPQNLILDNADYVISVVSSRLTGINLDPAAPVVLISMIRLVGAEIVEEVQDIIDEIFDALDDYHGYDALCSTLLAVLDTLMKVMATAAPIAEHGRSEEKETTTVELARKYQPHSEEDFEDLKKWFNGHSANACDPTGDVEEESTPQRPWGKQTEDPDGHEEEPPSGLDDEPKRQPTRSQTVCLQILQKAIFFISHSSAFIRGRVLSLIASAITVLGPTLEGELLPLINKAWPYILRRLSKEEEVFVIQEAANLLDLLAEHTGDFIGARVRDDAWPMIMGLLKEQKEVEKNRSTGLVKRNATVPLIGGQTKFSSLHRIYKSILQTLTHITRSVPIPETLRWEISLLARPFLDISVQEELASAAENLFFELGRLDEDAVWCALMGTCTEIDGVQWIHNDGWAVKERMDAVVARLALAGAS